MSDVVASGALCSSCIDSPDFSDSPDREVDWRSLSFESPEPVRLGLANTGLSKVAGHKSPPT